MKQNEVSSGYFQNFKPDIDAIIKNIENQTGFKSDAIFQKSQYWNGDKIGALFIKGIYQNQPTNLKIQLAKLDNSEIDFINEFNKHNQSKIIRPPHLYAFLRWNDELKYEALILEDIETKPIISIPTNQKEIDIFFEIYQEYKKNCLFPWLDRPDISIPEMVHNRFTKWKEIRQNQFSKHPFFTSDDEKLINQAINLLIDKYQSIDWVFAHGHFGHKEIYPVDNQFVLLSNLYWSWRAPFYDAVFAHNWFLCELSKFSSQEILKQNNLWLDKICQQSTDQKLINLALLERATARLNLDALICNPKDISTEFIFNTTRDLIKSSISDIG